MIEPWQRIVTATGTVEPWQRIRSSSAAPVARSEPWMVRVTVASGEPWQRTALLGATPFQPYQIRKV